MYISSKKNKQNHIHAGIHVIKNEKRKINNTTPCCFHYSKSLQDATPYKYRVPTHHKDIRRPLSCTPMVLTEYAKQPNKQPFHKDHIHPFRITT